MDRSGPRKLFLPVPTLLVVSARVSRVVLLVQQRKLSHWPDRMAIDSNSEVLGVIESRDISAASARRLRPRSSEPGLARAGLFASRISPWPITTARTDNCIVTPQFAHI